MKILQDLIVRVILDLSLTSNPDVELEEFGLHGYEANLKEDLIPVNILVSKIRNSIYFDSFDIYDNMFIIHFNNIHIPKSRTMVNARVELRTENGLFGRTFIIPETFLYINSNGDQECFDNFEEMSAHSEQSYVVDVIDSL
jgi:hypothetical protein